MTQLKIQKTIRKGKIHNWIITRNGYTQAVAKTLKSAENKAKRMKRKDEVIKKLKTGVRV